MSFLNRFLPGFKSTYLLIGGLYVLLSANILLRGVSASMEPFGVPAAVLDAPHYENAIWWVYTHMLVLGMVMCVIGQFAKDKALKLWISRALLVAHLQALLPAALPLGIRLGWDRRPALQQVRKGVRAAPRFIPPAGGALQVSNHHRTSNRIAG